MEPQIVDYYNEFPNIVNVIDKMNDELVCLQGEYDLLKKTYEISNDYPSMVNKAMRTDNDMAKLLYELYGKYNVCTSIKKNEWYFYDGKMKKWRLSDGGIELRMKLSNEIHNLYMKKGREYMDTHYADGCGLPEPEPGEDSFDTHFDIHFGNHYLKTCINLKNPRYKQKIMKECKEVFYKEDFLGNYKECIEDLSEYYKHDYYGVFPKI